MSGGTGRRESRRKVSRLGGSKAVRSLQSQPKMGSYQPAMLSWTRLASRDQAQPVARSVATHRVKMESRWSTRISGTWRAEDQALYGMLQEESSAAGQQPHPRHPAYRRQRVTRMSQRERAQSAWAD